MGWSVPRYVLSIQRVNLREKLTDDCRDRTKGYPERADCCIPFRVQGRIIRADYSSPPKGCSQGRCQIKEQ